MTNLPPEAERVRSYCGIAGKTLMIVMGLARELLTNAKSKSRPGTLPAKTVCAWLPADIHWGMRAAPTEKTVAGHLRNYDALLRDPTCRFIIDEAKVEFGRDNSFDLPCILRVLLRSEADMTRIQMPLRPHAET